MKTNGDVRSFSITFSSTSSTLLPLECSLITQIEVASSVMSVLLHSEQRKADADDLRWQFSQQLRLLPQSYQCFDILLSIVRPREATMFTIDIETGSRPRDQIRCGDLDYDAKLSPSMLVHRLQRPTISRLHLTPPLIANPCDELHHARYCLLSCCNMRALVNYFLSAP